MPTFKCDPDVLVTALGSITGVRRTLMKRGVTNIVSETGNDVEHVLVVDHLVGFYTLCCKVGPADRPSL